MSRACTVVCLLFTACLAVNALSPYVADSSKQQSIPFLAAEGKVTAMHPKPEDQAVGSTAVYTTDLRSWDKKGDRLVGSATWTGTYIATLSTSGGGGFKVHYLVNIEITDGDYKGTLVASGIGGGVYISSPVTLVVLGGTGDFEGATGEITWGQAPPAMAPKDVVFYSFKLALPRTVAGSSSAAAGR